MLSKLLSHLAHQVFCDSMRPFVQCVHTDALGNIIAHKQGVGKKLILIAHADEVRLMITAIDNDGFLHIKPSGSIDASLLPARKVKIIHEDRMITGIIGKRPIHLQRPENDQGKVMFDSLWIDIGAKDKEDALTMVELGDYAYFDSLSEELPNGLLTGKALDDRAGLSVLLHIAENIKNKDVPWDIYFVASNYEEIGMRGAIVAANSIKPDYCIAIDVTHATDYPTMNPISDGDIRLNRGCVLAKGPNIDLDMFQQLKKYAIDNNIPIQIEAIPYATGTDANVIQIANGGIRTALVSIPCRYMHTPYEVVSTTDIDSTIELLTTFVQNNKKME